MKTTVKPPKKLSKLIMLALNDLIKVENSKVYRVDMDNWHTGRYIGEKCNVCFAGSVMAKTCKTPINKMANLTDFGSQWCNCFLALNNIRNGDLTEALNNFYGLSFDNSRFWGFKTDFQIENLRYENDPTEFKNAMCDVAAMLESLGL